MSDRAQDKTQGKAQDQAQGRAQDRANDMGLDDLLAQMRATTPPPSGDLTRRVTTQARQMQPQAPPVPRQMQPQAPAVPRRGRLARVWPLGGAWPLRAAAAAGLFGFALGLGGLLDAAVADDGGSAEMMFLPGGAAMADALLGAGDGAEVGNE